MKGVINHFLREEVLFFLTFERMKKQTASMFCMCLCEEFKKTAKVKTFKRNNQKQFLRI